MKQAESESTSKKLKKLYIEHYKFFTRKYNKDWKAILDLASKDDFDAASQARLQALQESAYPFWGELAQPAITYMYYL